MEECTKLLTFSKLVLADKLKDYKSIEILRNTIDETIEKLEKHKINENKKIIKTNIKYLKRCSKALNDLIR